MRILTTSIDDGYVLQIARPLTEVDASLDRLRTILILVALGGIGLAAALGLVVARTALAPVRPRDGQRHRELARRAAPALVPQAGGPHPVGFTAGAVGVGVSIS